MQAFTRSAARIQAIRLDGAAQMLAAHHWLRAHGVRDMLVANSDGSGFLNIYGTGTKMVGRIGDWLTYNPESGEFTVWDDEQFQATHSEVAGVGQ